MKTLITKEWQGHTVHLREGTSDEIVFKQVLVDETYKPVIGLRDYKLIIDGGGNIGLSSMYFAHHYHGSDVLMIEPDYDSYMMALKNGLEHGLNSALWSYCGWGKIANPESPSFAHQVVSACEPDAAFNLLTMDVLLWVSEYLRPCLVKLDIEGAEVEVLKDAHWLNYVDVLAIELHGRPAEEALDRALGQCGRQYRRWHDGVETTFVEFT